MRYIHRNLYLTLVISFRAIRLQIQVATYLLQARPRREHATLCQQCERHIQFTFILMQRRLHAHCHMHPRPVVPCPACLQYLRRSVAASEKMTEAEHLQILFRRHIQRRFKTAAAMHFRMPRQHRQNLHVVDTHHQLLLHVCLVTRYVHIQPRSVWQNSMKKSTHALPLWRHGCAFRKARTEEIDVLRLRLQRRLYLIILGRIQNRYLFRMH